MAGIAGVPAFTRHESADRLYPGETGIIRMELRITERRTQIVKLSRVRRPDVFWARR